MTDAGQVKNDWIHRYYPITDGPCAGQSIRSHAKTRHYELLSQVPRHTVWVCRPTNTEVFPGPWFEYVWNKQVLGYRHTRQQHPRDLT